MYHKRNICTIYNNIIETVILGGPQNLAHYVSYALTSSIIDQFWNLFRCYNQKKICNNTVTKDPTTSHVCLYTALWCVSVFKATTENKTTSVTTHFKSALSSNKADTLNIWCKTAGCELRGAIKSFSIQYDKQMTQTKQLYYFFYPSQIDFLRHDIEIRQPAWVHCYRKTSFHEGAASDVEIDRSRWVSWLVRKVGEKASQIRCPWLRPGQLETCAPEHYRAATADLGSAFPSASPSLPDADLSALHCSRVQSLLSSVVGNPLTARICNPIKSWPRLSSRRLSAELPGWRRVDVFALHRLLFSCLDPSGESSFHHQLLYGTTRYPGLHCR